MPRPIMLLAFALLILQISQSVAADKFYRQTCWCRNDTQIGFINHYAYYNTLLAQEYPIDEKCVDFIEGGQCAKYPNQQTLVCRDYLRKTFLLPMDKVNTFCYHHRGHEKFTKGNEDDVLRFNKHKRNIPKSQIVRNVSVDNVNAICGVACHKNFHLPVMLPYDPGHGIIESHAEHWDGFWALDNRDLDGSGGYREEGHDPFQNIPNDKGGPDGDVTGHYGPEGYYDLTGWDGKGLLDRLPHIG
ncbi:MAG: hypothetical protein Q9174_000612 [Haloplaca sp. 1 TL-2023]